MRFGLLLCILSLVISDAESAENHPFRVTVLHADGVELSAISRESEKTAPYSHFAELDPLGISQDFAAVNVEQVGTVQHGNGTIGTISSTSTAATWDVTPADVIISVPSSIHPSAVFTTTFILNEAVTGFADADVSVTGGTKGALRGSGSVYRMPIIADVSEKMGSKVVHNAAMDDVGGMGLSHEAGTEVGRWNMPLVHLKPSSELSMGVGSDIAPGSVLSSALPSDVTIPITTDYKCSGSCTGEGQSGGSASTAVTIPAGDQGDSSLTNVDSNDRDGIFTVALDAVNLSSRVRGGAPNQVAVISYEPKKVEFDLSPETVYEGESVTVTVRFLNSQTLPVDVTIPFLMYDQNWNSGKNPVVRPQAPKSLQVKIEAGAVEASGTLETIIDGSGRDEEVSVVFGTLPPEVKRTTADRRLIIKGSKRTVTLSATPNPVFEGSPDGVAVTAELSYAHSQEVRIPLTYRDKTTSGFSLTAEPADYDGVAFITIPVNRTIGEVTVNIPDEPLTPEDREDETFMVAIDESTLPSDLVAGLEKEVEITIVDKDRPLVHAQPLVVEEGKTGDLKVTLTEPPSGTFTIEIGGYQNTDFEATPPDPLTLQFDGTDWDTPKSVTLTAAEDDDDYEDDDVELLLTVKIGNQPFGTGVKVPVTISDNDKVEVNLELLSPAVIPEGENPVARIKLELSKALPNAVAIPLLMTQDLPTSGQSAALCPAIILAGAKKTEYEILRAADDDDKDEQYTVTLDSSPPPGTSSSCSGHVFAWPVEVLEGPDNSVTFAIQDRPVVKLTASPMTVNEGDSVEVRLELSYALGQDVRIKVNAVPRADPAYAMTSWDDFEKLWDGTGILIPKGTTIGRDTVTIRADFEAESDEVFNLGYPSSLLPEAVRQGKSREISLPGTPCDDLTCAIIIKDVEPKQVVTLSASPNPVFEGNSTTLTLTLTKPLPPDMYGNRGLQILSNDPNSQADKNDFALPYPDEQLRIWNAWMFLFGEGETRKDVVIEIEDDGLDEGDENLIWDVAGYISGNMEANRACNNDPDSVCEVTIEIRDPVEIVANPSDFMMREGGSATFEVSLNTAPSADVTVTISDDGDSDLSWAGTAMLTDGNKLTFTPTDYSTPQPVSLTAGEDDSDIANDTETLTLTASGAPEYTGVSADVEVTIIDNDRGITVMPSVVTIDEGATVRDAFKVSLTAAPTGEVRVVLGDDGDSDLSWAGTAGLTDGNKLTFTPANYSTPQPVSLTATEDDDYVNDVEFLALIAFGAEYEGNYAKSMQVTITDNDNAEIIATPPDVPVMEGGTATFRVSLSVKPSGNVTVAVSGHTGTDLATTPPDPPSLTFTSANYNTPQQITITADDDPDITNDPVTLILTGSSSDAEYNGLTTNVAVTIEDNDAGTIIASPSDVPVAEGGTATFNVSLSAMPSQNVTVAVSGHTGTDLAGTPPDPPSLIFKPSDYNTPQQITITADDDQDITIDIVTLTLTGMNAEYDGLTARVTVIIENDDIGSIRAPFLLTMNEGETEKSLLEVSLSHAPYGPVTVTVTGHEGTDVEGTSPDSPDPVKLIFTQTNYSIRQPVSLTAKEDDDSLDDTVNLLLKATGAEYSGLTKRSRIQILDNDDANIIATPPVLRIKEGGTATFDVTLSAAPSRDVTVELHGYKKTALEATPPDPLRLTFTPANYGMPQEITLSADHDLNLHDESTTLGLLASGAEYNNVLRNLPVSIDDDDVWELTIKEGGTKAIGTKLGSAPRSNIVAEITGHTGTDLNIDPSTWTFTPQNYSTPWKKIFTAGEDPDIWDDEVMLIWEEFGRGYKYDTNMRFTIEDNDDGKIIATPSDIPVTEGGTATFDVTLSHAPSQNVTVAVGGYAGTDLAGTPPDPLSLTFMPDNYGTPQQITVTADEDPDITNDLATLILTGSNAEYDGVTTNVAVTIEDNDAGTIIANPSTVKIREGDAATFEVSLSAAPSQNVTVAVSGHAGTDLAGTPPHPLSLTFRPDNYNTPQQITITADEDQDIIDDKETLILETSGAEYDGLREEVRVTIKDNDDGVIIATPSAVTMTEGTTETFDVTLGAAPSANVKVKISGYSGTDLAGIPPDPLELTFTPTDHGKAQTVTLTAGEDADVANDMETLRLTASGAEYAGGVTDVKVSIIDKDQAGIVANPSIVPVAEGTSAKFDVTLSAAPSADVTVAITGYRGTDLAPIPPNPDRLTFTPTDYGKAQTVTLTAGTDLDVIDETETLLLTASGAGYTGVKTNVTVTIKDKDAGSIIAPAALTMTEGSTEIFKLSLSNAPSEDVTMAITGYMGTDLAGIPPSPNKLTFTKTNYGDAQTVTLTAGVDPDIVDDIEALILTASGAEYAGMKTKIAVTIKDKDAGSIIAPAALTMTEGSTGSFDVSLSNAPSENVTVLVSGHAGTGLAGTPPNPLRLTFTPADYGTPQPVTLTADEDNHDLFDKEVTLTLTASGAEYAGESSDLAVTIEDNDDGAIIATPSAVTMTEGDTQIFNVSLSAMPSANVTVAVSGYEGTDLAGTPPSPLILMFTKTNYSTPQALTLTADQDPDIINEKETLRLTAAGAEYAGVSTLVTVSIIDNDQTGIVVSPSAVTVLEGAAATFDVSLSAMPSANVTVAVSGYAGTDLAGTPPNPLRLTFTSANYNTAQSVTLTAEEDLDILDDQERLLLTASGSEYDGVTVNVPITIEDAGHDPGTSVHLSASPISVIEGGTITVTATLSKAFSEAVTIPLEYTPGTPGPTEPNDYDRLSGITILGGALSGSGEIVTKEDRVLEGDETFMVALGDLPSDLDPGIPASLELTIEDNDMLPPVEITLSVDPQEVIEGNWVTVAVTLAGALDVDATIPLVYTAGTSEPGDYRELEHVTVPGGETKGTGQIQTFQDSDLEDETFIVALGSDLPPEVDPGRASFQTITIRDIIPPQDVNVQFLTATQSVNEGKTVPVTIELNEGLPADVVIPLTVISGTADAQDYRVSSPIQVEIKAGETRGTSVIPTIQDDIVELDEIFSVEVGELPSGIVPGERSKVVVTIIDDDEAGINVQSSVSIVEGTSGIFNFSLTSKPLNAVSVEIAWLSGTDLTVVPVQRIFTPDNWQTFQFVIFYVAEDVDLEDDFVAVTLTATGGGYIGISKTVNVTIIDNDAAGIHAPASMTVSEGGSETFDIRLIAAPSAAVTVTVPGTLGDLTATPARLTFTEDNWARPRSITLMAGEDDDFLADTETLILTASGGGYDGETREMSVTIMDDDEPGIEAPLEVTIEEGGTGTLPVRLLAAPSGPVTLTLAGHMGTDLALSETSLTFTGKIWNLPQMVTLTAAEDDDDFTDDRVELVLTASGGDYDHVHTTLVTVVDNDEQELPLTIGIYDERESEDAGSLQLAIELSRSDDEAVTVQYATSDIEAAAGADYTASRGVVIFDPGATRGVIEIEIMDDDIFEESERFTVTLSNPVNAIIARGTGTGTILDNDGSAKLRVDDALVQEEEGVVVFRVLLSHPQREMVTAEYRTQDGSAKAGEDYEASSGVVTIAPGTMEALIAVSILKDGLDWQEETFTVHLESAKHAEIEKAVGVATIQESTTVSEGVLEAYASRFVRTASVEVVDALGDRFRAAADGAMCTAAERAEMAQLWYSASSWDPSLGELLADCRLSQSMPVSGGSFGVWGQGAFRQFNGRGDEALTLRGEVTTGMLGADYRWHGGWLAGVLLAHSQGDGSFEVKEESGEITSALTGIYPYVSYTRAGWDVWMSAGAGRGNAEVSELKGDLISRFGAMGMRGTLASGGAVGLSYHGDILVTDAEIADHNITAEVYRVRAGIEVTTQITGEVRPYVEANVRQDGGSAETGTGLELGGGVRFSNPAWRLRGEVRTQGLVLHTADGFTEWGISGSLQMGGSSEGLMMRLRPSWGRGHGMSMYNQQTILDAAPTGANAHRTELELGYGVPWKGGSARSIMGVTQLSRGMMYRLGGELRPWERLSFSVFGLAHGYEATLGDIGVNVQGSLRY